jgi:hypothetical protein
MDNQLQFIEDAFNLSINTSNKKSGHIINISNELYSRINNTLKLNFGDQVYTCDISPENLMSYKNGKISSILKDRHEIYKHYGFDVISITNITDMLINEIHGSLVNEIISGFNKIAFEIINSFMVLEYQMYDKIIKVKENEYADEIASYKLLFEEIAEEIGLISITPDRRISYTTNIIDMKKNIYKIYGYYLRKLNQWASSIRTKDLFGNYTYINFTELNKDICFARQIISSYMVTLIYEYLLSCNIDFKSKATITRKINKFIERYNPLYQNIKNNLLESQEDNKLYYWFWRSDKATDNSNINWLLNEINNPRRKQRGIEDFSLKSLRMWGNKSPTPPVLRPKRGWVLNPPLVNK